MQKKVALAVVAVAILATVGMILDARGGEQTQPAAVGSSTGPAQVRPAAEANAQKLAAAPQAAAPSQNKATQDNSAPAAVPPAEPTSPATSAAATGDTPTQVRNYLNAVDQLNVPRSDQLKDAVRPYQDRIRAMLDANEDDSSSESGEFCDYYNAVRYSVASWLQSAGISDPGAAGLPSTDTKCPANPALATTPW